MDQLFKVLWSNHEIKREVYAEIKDFVDVEEYDTESIQMDLEDDGTGNITSHAYDEQVVKTMKSFIQENKRK